MVSTSVAHIPNVSILECFRYDFIVSLGGNRLESFTSVGGIMYSIMYVMTRSLTSCDPVRINAIPKKVIPI